MTASRRAPRATAARWIFVTPPSSGARGSSCSHILSTSSCSWSLPAPVAPATPHISAQHRAGVTTPADLDHGTPLTSNAPALHAHHRLTTSLPGVAYTFGSEARAAHSRRPTHLIQPTGRVS